MTTITRTLTFLSLLSLAGCAGGQAQARRTTCQAYDAVRTACAVMPEQCPWREQ